MFETAKKSTTKAAPKKSAKEKVVIEVPGMETLATIKTITKALEGLAESVEAEVKDDMASNFVKLGCAKKKKPDSFTGVEGNATASCELRKRSARSVLSAEEQELLKKHKVSMETVEDVKETFVINYAYKDDQVLLGKVSNAISKIKGMPEDFIVHQEQQARVTTTADSLDEIFQKKPDVAAMLLSVVGTLAVKPKLVDGDITDAIEKLNEILA